MCAVMVLFYPTGWIYDRNYTFMHKSFHLSITCRITAALRNERNAASVRNKERERKKALGPLAWRSKQGCRCPSNKQALTPGDRHHSPPAKWLVIDKPKGGLIYVKNVYGQQPPGIELGVILRIAVVFEVVSLLLSLALGPPGRWGQRCWRQRWGRRWTKHWSGLLFDWKGGWQTRTVF